MYNAQIVTDRVRAMAKKIGVSQKVILERCNLNENLLNKMTDKRGISSFALAKIADCLSCSVDYLLGRTDNPDVMPETYSNNTIMTGDINGSQQVSMHIGKQEHSQADMELLELINGLSLVQRAKVIVMINEMKSE